MRVYSALLVLLLASNAYPAECNRRSFNHWVDLDKDGLDTREEFVKAEVILGDKFICPYTGELASITKAELDHVVPLQAACDLGADKWTDERREEFANDPLNLVLVQESVNASKSDKIYSDWLPPNLRYAPSYLLRWKAVCDKYSLDCDISDIDTMIVKYKRVKNGVRPWRITFQY